MGGTVAAKLIFIVDNDLESKTEFSGKNWHLNCQSIQKCTSEIEKLSDQYIDRLRKFGQSKRE